jgi:hypothetical protein
VIGFMSLGSVDRAQETPVYLSGRDCQFFGKHFEDSMVTDVVPKSMPTAINLSKYLSGSKAEGMRAL